MGFMPSAYGVLCFAWILRKFLNSLIFTWVLCSLDDFHCVLHGFYCFVDIWLCITLVLSFCWYLVVYSMVFIALLIFGCVLHGRYLYSSIVLVVKHFIESHGYLERIGIGRAPAPGGAPVCIGKRCMQCCIGKDPGVSSLCHALVTDMCSLQYSNIRPPLEADMGAPSRCHQLALLKSLPTWGVATNTWMRRFRHLLVLRKRLLNRGRMKGEIRVANFQPICSGLLRGGYAC